MRSALFLDLGGTLVRLEGDQIHEDGAGRVHLLPGVAARLASPGYDVVLVVTNQAGLERGTLTPERVRGWIDQINAACGGVVVDHWAAPTLAS
ncbi:MAG: hypothetical protein IT299_01175, partial [Dehalococcoidia bacterium]|nr:hypothetical protein [Dehalococcoidia bacterium]